MYFAYQETICKQNNVQLDTCMHACLLFLIKSLIKVEFKPNLHVFNIHVHVLYPQYKMYDNIAKWIFKLFSFYNKTLTIYIKQWQLSWKLKLN